MEAFPVIALFPEPDIFADYHTVPSYFHSHLADGDVKEGIFTNVAVYQETDASKILYDHRADWGLGAEEYWESSFYFVAAI